ncbi:hypothetical protein BBK82_03090 [Lentzea guizhouensis]|uniref:Uncharacterized protein n=1 Tax=Lentzea guizhouensis TaxID=1586287 RepID=A0A1B2HBW4_9PSEU|nr:hypothetical protein [Lentzea guizhouensis]ANZ35203.1 hypothetical protein BBK82_03090 [Lentzea guizhouensis]
MADEPAVTMHPTPWTAFFEPDDRQWHLLDVNGDSAATVGDQAVAQTIARLVNEAARRCAAHAPLAVVLPLADRRTVDAPPAPNPSNGAATQWDELFDHLIFLLETGAHGLLRTRLFDYAGATVGLPLPSCFRTGSNRGSSA